MKNTDQNNPLLCDMETGICEMPATNVAIEEPGVATAEKRVRVIYYTDPICSSCWGIEPQLRKLKLEYGNSIEMEYRMGGLLPDWSYNGGGISKPADVARHWDEASAYYNMPIDGDVWLENPLPSSFPPSIAFKAAEMQDKEKAVQFLREIRELLFLQKKNIAEWNNISLAAQKAGLDVAQLQKDYESDAQKLFVEDLKLAQQLGVRGFPTMFFVNNQGQQEKVYGSKPYEVYEKALLKLQPAARKHSYETDWQHLFTKHSSLTSREYAELSGTPQAAADSFLQKLHEAGDLDKLATRNGALWRRKVVAH